MRNSCSIYGVWPLRCPSNAAWSEIRSSARDAIEPGGRRGPLIGRQLEQLEPSRREIDFAPGQVPIPYPVAGTRRGERISLFAGPQRSIRFLPCDGIANRSAQQFGRDVSLDQVILRSLGNAGDRTFFVLPISEDDDRKVRALQT